MIVMELVRRLRSIGNYWLSNIGRSRSTVEMIALPMLLFLGALCLLALQDSKASLNSGVYGEVVIVGGARTPFEWQSGKRGDGQPGGLLKDYSALKLGNCHKRRTGEDRNIA